MMTRAKLQSNPTLKLTTPSPSTTPGRKKRQPGNSWTKSGKFKLPPEAKCSLKQDIKEEKNGSTFINRDGNDTDETESYAWNRQEEASLKYQKQNEEGSITDDETKNERMSDLDNESVQQLSLDSQPSVKLSNQEDRKSLELPPQIDHHETTPKVDDHNSVAEMSIISFDKNSSQQNDISTNNTIEQESEYPEKSLTTSDNTKHNDSDEHKRDPSKPPDEDNTNDDIEEETFDINDEKRYELENQNGNSKNENKNTSMDNNNEQEDNVSFVSQNTTKGGNNKDHDDDVESPSSSEEATQEEDEDDVNTVNSENTAAVEEGVKPPPYTRYRLMIAPITEEEMEETPNITPLKRIRSKLIAFCEYMREMDADSQILTWTIKENFSFLPIDQIPDKVLGLQKYFQGIRANMKNDRKTYISLSVHTPNDKIYLQQKLEAWAESFGYSLVSCLIQTSSAKYVGWLAYSSYFTELEFWKIGLENNTGYEWGLKMVAVTNADRETKWNKRLKAVGLFVPEECADHAQAAVAKFMERNKRSKTRPLLSTDKYLFGQPEDEIITS